MILTVFANAVRSFAPLGDQVRLLRSCAAMAHALSTMHGVAFQAEEKETACHKDAASLWKAPNVDKAGAAAPEKILQRGGLGLGHHHTMLATNNSRSCDLAPAISERQILFSIERRLRQDYKSVLPPLARQFSSTSVQESENSRDEVDSKRSSSSSGVVETAHPPQQDASWLGRTLPKSWLAYALLMRLDKPIGTWLLAWPCFWSIALATPQGSVPDLRLIGLFGIGALLLRGAGCTVNDLWDQDLDKKVERTRGRPLASGALTTGQGIGLLGAQLLFGLGVLVQLNSYSIALGAYSLALVFTYPLMKRITFWPQAFLGLTFNWGALLGYAAVKGACEWPVVLPLYLGGVCWTLVYDTIYAHQDKVDDATAGVKSTALLFGENTRIWLSGFALSATSLWALTGYLSGSGGLFYVGALTAGCHMMWQVHRTDLNSRCECMASFVSNKWLGGLMFTGIVLDKFS